MSEYEYSAMHAIEIIETAPAGEPFTHNSPVVFGEGNHKSLHGVTRSQYIACIEDARVRGRSATIMTTDGLLLDFQGDEPSRLDDELEWDPAIFYVEKGTVLCIPARDDCPSLEIETAFSLLGAHTDFFGHWMIEYLPKYVAAVLLGNLAIEIPVLIDAHMPTSHRESLTILFGDAIKLIEVPAFVEVCVNKLWCAPTLMYMPLHEKRNEKFSWEAVSASPERLSPVIKDMVRRTDEALVTPGNSPKYIFLARKAFRHRKLLNFKNIEHEAIKLGFEIVYPEDHTFAEQVILLRNAKTIVAPEGSAIFLAFFAKMGSKLIILSHPLTDVLVDYNGILSMQGIELSVLTGPISQMDQQTPHDSDYEIENAKFVQLLNECM